MRSRLISCVLVFAWLGAAYAQTPPAPPQTAPTHSGQEVPAASLKGAGAQKLIGHVVINEQNDKIGEIKSVRLDRDDVVDVVIVNVGGFLGIGDHEVALAWRDLKISHDGAKVSTALSHDQLKAMPAYRYKDFAQRGTVFRDVTPPDGRTSPPPAASPPQTVSPPQPALPPPAPTIATTPRAGFNAGGDLSGIGIARATVRNPAGETIGTVEEIVLSADGTVKSIIVSVGGFLGVGSKRVAMKWTDFKVWQDKDQLTLVTEITKDDLKSAADYKPAR